MRPRRRRPSVDGMDARLLRAAQTGDRAARDRLVADCVPWLHDLAHHYRGLGLGADDLVQEGALGLIDAIEHFDPDRGMPFERYARFRARNAMRDALTESSRLVRLPKHVVERRRAIDRYAARAAAATGHWPTAEQIAGALDLDVAEVVVARDAPVAVAVADVAADPLASTREEADPVAVPDVAGALETLAPRQREIVERHFGIGAGPERLGDIADSLHVSRQRARTIELGALARLRDILEQSVA